MILISRNIMNCVNIMNFVNIEVHESQLLLMHLLPSHPSKEPNPRKKTCLEKMPSNANPELKRSQGKKLIYKETSCPYSNCSNQLKEARTKSNVWKRFSKLSPTPKSSTKGNCFSRPADLSIPKA